MNLGYGKTSTSPIIAKKNAMLRSNDRFLINRDRLLPDAITAINDASEQALFIRPNLSMPGATVFKEMTEWLAKNRDKGFFTPHDVVVGTEMARIVTGGEIEPGTVWSEQDLYDAERRSFIRLVSGEATRLRIETMLENGSPIRN
jgi:3-hydroxyacyl-CoA dehydrogenase